MIARYPGRCACSATFPVGASVEYDRATRKVTRCPACNGAAAPIGTPDAPVLEGTEPAAPVETSSNSGSCFASLVLPSKEEAWRSFDALTKRLDADQKVVAAWEPAAGNVRVVAAAGSGKTTTSVALVARLLWGAILAAGDIIATTFTRKAADELVQRLVAVLPPGSFDPASPGRPGTLRVGTFHALALQTLRRQNPGRWNLSRCLGAAKRAAGVPSEAALWGRVLDYAGPEGVPGLGVEGLGLENADVKSYMLAAGCVRSKGLRGDALLAELRKVEREEGLPYLVTAYETVCNAKEALQAFGFDDMLSSYLDGLRDGSIKDGARLVVVDEAQDNSAEQIEIATLLAKNGNGNVLLVGDVRQAIYEWRGAAPQLMQEADKGLSAATWELTHNYRSVPGVVALGNRVAAGKPWSLGSASVAARTDAGHITVNGYEDPGEEAAGIAHSIRSALDEGATLTRDGQPQFAVLVRTNAAAGCIEAAMVSAKIPAVVVGGTPFFARREVMDVLAYVRLASGANDMESFGRIVNRPRRYLGKAFVAKVAAAGGAADLEGAIDACVDSLWTKQKAAARDLRAFVSELRAAVWPAQVEMIAKLLAPADEDGAGEADADRSGIPAAVADIGRGFASAGEFLSFAARCAGEVTSAQGSEALGFDIPDGRVVIMTVHKAKGLEFEHVYVSASETVFPHRRAMSKPRQLAGEERLFYVATTRAKTFLHLTWAEVNLFGKSAGPSRFLDYVEVEKAPEPPPSGPQGGGEPALVDVVEALTGIPAGGYGDPEGSDVRFARERREQATAEPKVKNTAAGLRQMPFAGLKGVEAVEQKKGLFDLDAFAAALIHAEAETANTPAPADGSRFVQPTTAQFEALLAPLDFVSVTEKGQVVLAWNHDWFTIRVYSSIPADGYEAREVGEDSIKVAALWIEENDGRVRPLHKKLPYAQRTHGWRNTVLDKIAEVATLVVEADAHRCRKCGAPTAERKRADGGKSFRGCVRYPDCRGSN